MTTGWILVVGACVGAPPATTHGRPTSGTDAPLAVRFRERPGIRDLVAEPSRPAALVYRHGDETVEGDGVPARLVFPGDTWTVTATADGQVATDELTVADPPGGDVLVLLIDDVGIDHVGAYGVNPYAPPTPRIDELAASGERFDRAYASPVCSPSRGELLSGRHARRTGLGWIVDTGDRDGSLPLATTTIPEALRLARGGTWSNGAIGKWHLDGPENADAAIHPLEQGFSSFAGTIGNPSYQEGWGYWRWDKDVDGTIEESTTYMTTATVDDALDRMATLPEPWFLYVAFNAAHTPLSAPPPDLVSAPVPPDADLNELFDATVEALDTEIGRLLDTMDPAVRERTTIVLLGDNGTPAHAIDPPLDPDHGKDSVYEGGVRVPFVVAGPEVAVPGSVSKALVHVEDVFVLVAELAGIPLGGPDDALVLDDGTALDGRPVLPLLADPSARGRDTVYAEGFFPNGPGPYSLDRRSLRDDRWSLVRFVDHEELYDLGDDPGLADGPNQLVDPSPEAMDAWGRLSSELDRIEATVGYEGY